MRKPFRIAVVVVTVVALTVVVCAGVVLRPHGPYYKGKRLSYWLEGYTPRKQDRPGDPTHREADEAVRGIGTNAIPTLLRFLRTKDSALTRCIFELFPEESQRSKNWWRYRQAARAFKTLGPEASSAVPALIEICDQNISEGSRTETVAALGWIGSAARPAVPALVELLKDGTFDARENATNALKLIDPEAAAKAGVQ